MLPLVISYMLIYTVALMLVAFGGMFSERSGVINIGLEGTMVVSCLAGVLVLTAMNKAGLNPILIVVITMLVSILTGVIYSLLLAVACVTFRADQTLVGTAMNLLSTSLAMIITKKANGQGTTSMQYNKDMFLFKFLGVEMNVFFFIGVIVLIAAIIVLYKLKFGLRLKACGENPSAADSVGLNVKKYRYYGVLISGALAGIGALAYMFPITSYWNASIGVSGFGFLALAVMIFGQWKPGRIAVVAVFFSFFMAVSFLYYGIFEEMFGVLLTADKGVTSELFKMIPYILSLLLLAFTSKHHHAPAAEGIPYDKEKR